MSKFVIECPRCGKFAEAKTGFFARKKINCTCGNIINIRTDKLTSRTCAHCGNNVVFDQSRADKARCPVCHEPINEISDISKMEDFSCGQCGIRLTASKGAKRFVCPVCDFDNDVPARIAQEHIKKDGLASIIKYEGDADTIVWKHPIEDFNLGSQLIVHESQEAVFFKDGQALDIFGSGRYALETQQLPLLENLYHLPTDTEGTFHSEVYFVNMSTQMGIKWGTDTKVRMFDPATGMYVELGASGEFNVRVANSKKLLLKIVGTTGGLSQSQLLGEGSKKGVFRSMVMTQVKSCLAQAIKESGINILEIDAHLINLSNIVKSKIAPELAEYGLELSEFYINRIVTPDDDPNFRRLKQQYAQEYLSVREQQIRKKEAEAAAERMAVEAQTTAKMKIIGAQGDAEAMKIKKAAEAEMLRMQGQAEADKYRMQAQAEAEEMKMKGYTYQQETSRMVGMEALKNGLTGHGGSGGGVMDGLGDLAGLGISLGAMGSVIGMTKDALNPVAETGMNMGSALGGIISDRITPVNSWDCSCGNKGITGRFCTECGAKKPEPKETWDCTCGNKGITGKFCSECGAKKPEKETWDCTCGNKGITGKFCSECGAKKPEKETWDCACGNKDITGKFCTECGAKKLDNSTWDCSCGNKGITGKFCPECGNKKGE